MNVKYEIDLNLIIDKTLGEIKNTSLLVKSKGGSVNAGIDQKVGIACLYAWNQLERLDFTSFGLKLTLRDLYQLNSKFGEEFIHIHRMSYMMYCVMLGMYDYLDDRKMLQHNVKRYWKKIETTFEKYVATHRSLLDESTWSTIQDHMRLASDKVQPFIEPLEVSIRDYMIQKRAPMIEAGQKDDIILLTKLQVCLMFCAAVRNTRKSYLDKCVDKWGVDFTNDYTYTDLTAIGRNFVWMMESLGVKFAKDKDGDYVLAGIKIEDSVRVESAWNAICNIVCDEELMDQTALEAINMNPATKADYEAVIAKENEKELSQAIGDLSSKFKVSSL